MSVGQVVQASPVGLPLVLDALRGAGVAPADPERLRLDGTLCRFDLEGARRGRRHGWLVAHLNGARPVLVVGDWRTGEHQVIVLDDGPISVEERNRWRRDVAQARHQRRWEIAGRHRKVRVAAVELWDVASAAHDRHGYLVRKQLPGRGLRQSAGNLLVPMRDAAGRLWNLQRIRADGTKRYLKDGKVSGLYCAIGATREALGPVDAGGAPEDPSGGLRHLLIAEGWATAMALHRATGLPSAAALSAHNLEAVAQGLRVKYPKARITLCADHDDVGLEKARAAARKIQGHLAVPPGKGTDWWDVWRQEGGDMAAFG